MENLHVGVVVPKANIACFPVEYRAKIASLAKFVAMVKEQQLHIPPQFAAILN